MSVGTQGYSTALLTFQSKIVSNYSSISAHVSRRIKSLALNEEAARRKRV